MTTPDDIEHCRWCSKWGLCVEHRIPEAGTAMSGQDEAICQGYPATNYRRCGCGRVDEDDHCMYCLRPPSEHLSPAAREAQSLDSGSLVNDGESMNTQPLVASPASETGQRDTKPADFIIVRGRNYVAEDVARRYARHLGNCGSHNCAKCSAYSSPWNAANHCLGSVYFDHAFTARACSCELPWPSVERVG